jgi:hypothetical protein
MRPDTWSDRLLGIVRGEATSAQIEGWVDASWRDGRFVDVVPAEILSKLPTTGYPVARYGDPNILRSEVCFRHPHGPGGVVVHTPPLEVWSLVERRYCVAPHVHRHAHVTVVLRGESHFFIARSADGRNRVLQVAVRPGHVLPCPAGSAHTFGSTGGAFTVLSIQARFVDPGARGFASNVGVFDGFPIVTPDVGLAH